jgi:uncharacterized protein YecE (DUF72 family)
MQVLAGTSGYSYKEWKGSFYPEDLPASRMLAYYAGRLPTVEINNTFYRMPSRKVVQGWAAQVPPSFSFVLKASNRITHKKRLADAGEELAYLIEVAGELGRNVGPMLFQLPPFLRKDLDRLQGFLALLPEGFRCGLEFRHASWFDEEVYGALRARNAALVVSEGDGPPEPPLVPTADYGYLRLRKARYAPEEIEAWAARVLAQPWRTCHVFFKHEDEGTGPKAAAAFLGHVRAGDGAGS